MNKEFLRMQKLAGLITEVKIEPLLYSVKGDKSFRDFVKIVIKNIFKSGLNDPMIEDIGENDWDTLFKFWYEFGNLELHTQQDIIDLANQVNVSEEDINYILDLPQVSALEKG
jgi:hypothetical protein